MQYSQNIRLINKKLPPSVWLVIALGLISSCSGGNSEPVDSDMDGVINSSDNCINTPNLDQADFDNDRTGNACDSDYLAGLTSEERQGIWNQGYWNNYNWQ